LTGQTDVKDKIVIGLTGNIATGKSAIMRLAAERGALTIDADKIVHDLLNEDKAAQEAIAEAFGESVRLENGRIDRAALGEIVFGSAEALQELEQIVHPRVGIRIAALLQESDAGVVMIEAIKLLEGQLWTLCREIWVTTCSYECQLQRLEVCRGMERSAAEARIKAQGPAEEKIARADVVIDTNGLMQDTERQFTEAWSRLFRH
jgi:dephospho-CoA kinase